MPVRVAVEKVAGLVDVIMPLKMLRIALSALQSGLKLQHKQKETKVTFEVENGITAHKCLQNCRQH